MKRSITRVLVLVTAATVMVLGLPLAFLVHRNFHDNAVVGFEPWYDFPFNEGKLCPKGVKRYLQGSHP